jgi:hypothetical protein
MKMILLSVGIFLLSLGNILAEKVITCEALDLVIGHWLGCRFSGVTIGPNETITIKTDPADLDVNSVNFVDFVSSSIHSIPSEIFTKFPKLEWFMAGQQNIQEVKEDTFKNGKDLTMIVLWANNITFLHKDTFRGKEFLGIFIPNPNTR